MVDTSINIVAPRVVRSCVTKCQFTGSTSLAILHHHHHHCPSVVPCVCVFVRIGPDTRAYGIEMGRLVRADYSWDCFTDKEKTRMLYFTVRAPLSRHVCASPLSGAHGPTTKLRSAARPLRATEKKASEFGAGHHRGRRKRRATAAASTDPFRKLERYRAAVTSMIPTTFPCAPQTATQTGGTPAIRVAPPRMPHPS